MDMKTIKGIYYKNLARETSSGGTSSLRLKPPLLGMVLQRRRKLRDWEDRRTKEERREEEIERKVVLVNLILQKKNYFGELTRHRFFVDYN